MTPQRIQRRRSKGWRMPAGARYVGRPSVWGNPFKPGELVRDPGWWNSAACPYDGSLRPGTYQSPALSCVAYEYVIRPVRDRADAVDLFREWVRFHDDVYPLDRIQRELGGRDLACWCPLPRPGQPDICHAAVLLALSNPGLPDPSRYPQGPKPYGWPPRSIKNVTDRTVIGGVL